MMERIRNVWNTIKNWWLGLTRTIKIIIVAGFAGIIVAIGLFAYFSNRVVTPEGYSVLYQNVSQEEAATIFSSLRTNGYDVQIDENYTIYVEDSQVELARLAMAAEGLPKTALSYDTFSSNTGFLTTELERETYLLYQLQDRIVATLEMMDGVKQAVVTLSEGETSQYAWSTSSTASKASVLLDLNYNYSMTPAQVKAIKYLVSSSVPNLEYDNVQVANTDGVLLSDVDYGNSENVNEIQLAFQKSYEENLENKVRKILAPIYGADNVAVSATVELDFDKMLSEETVYTPSGDQNTGVIDYLEQVVGTNKDESASGVVGEEDNTDVAIYPTLYDSDGNIVSESNVVDYLVSYLTKQVEKNQAKLIDASISVVILTDAEMTVEIMDALTKNVSAAVNLETTKVTVNSFPIPKIGEGGEVIDETMTFDLTTVIIIVVVAVLVALLIALILRLRANAKRRKAEAIRAAEEAELAAIQAEKERIEREKQEAMEAQQAESAAFKGTIDNIKQFASENPTIAAGLIKEWLREGEE